ncbi:dTDP-4-dehydrorhamnose reductase [Pseudokineococcus basanitobsidens]|uniref:dTDP-4-dehydrorhamnose reductase n=1 Tax=Pseudokineococcus basanitobsidens TaxID=1926649 RepID=A0ABU8RLE8_9ACTN
MSRTRWSVVGAAGMLGREMVDVLAPQDVEVAALARGDLDVTDAAACRDAVAGSSVVVNASAYTAVDAAEEHEAEAFVVNAVGAANLAAACSSAGARLVHVSTDYVFSGQASEPYAEDALPAPRSAYGRSKAAGEWAVLAADPQHMVVRTAWLYGDGPCFPRTVTRLLEERDTIAVVDDQVGQPTWSRDVAELVGRLVEAEVPGGVYHATSSGRATWHDLARSVARSAGHDPRRVEATTSDAFPRPAPRPAWSVLGHARLDALGVEAVGPWDERWEAASSAVLLPR